MNNSQVAHIWANQNKERASGSNFFFEGEYLYSYGRHFCVGRMVNGVAILNSNSYSVSTSKHQNYARAAVNYRNMVYCDNPLNGPNTNKKAALARIGELLVEHGKPRIRQTTRDRIEESIKSSVDEFNEYLNALPKAERRGIKLLPHVEVEKAKAKHAKAIAKDLRLQEKLRNETQARRIREHAERIAWTTEYNEKWIRDNSVRQTTAQAQYLPPVLRIVSDNIETSHGASIPLEFASTLWKMVKRVMATGESKHDIGMPIGHFRLDTIESTGNIVVGCHKIEYSELKRIAGILKFD